VTDRDGSWGRTAGWSRACYLTTVLIGGRGRTARVYRLASVLIKPAQVSIKEGGRGRRRDAFCDRILESIPE
jgi:hypothetical protein